MPEMRFIEPTEVPERPRRGRTAASGVEAAYAREWLQQAIAHGKVIELTLAPDERDATIKARFLKAAKAAKHPIHFQTASTRPYTNRNGRVDQEAEVLLIKVG